jgi:hypothetical protein
MSKLWRSGFAVLAIGLCAAVFGWAASRVAAPTRPLLPASGMDKAEARLVSSSSREIIVDFEAPFYETSCDPQTGEVAQFSVKGAQVTNEPGQPAVPVLVQPVDCPPGQIQLQILQSDDEPHPLPPFRPVPRDQQVLPESGETLEAMPQGESYDLKGAKLSEGLWPRQVVELSEGGVFRGHRLMALKFYPLRVDRRNQTLVWTRHVRVRLVLPDWEGTPEYLNRRFDSPNERALLGDLLGTLSGAALPTRQIEQRSDPVQSIQEELSEQFKIIVKEEGIYRVSQEMLASAGVPVEQIDPRTIKIKVRGREIPIFVQGEVDGVFDPYDYIEFYGIENRQTYAEPDQATYYLVGTQKVYYSSMEALYKDPWSDENVYWLSWNGPYGLRVGEENADWSPNVGERVLYLETTIHYEEDRYYDPLSRGGNALPYPSRLSQLGPYGTVRDHWFYRAGVRGFETLNIPVHIFYPDTQSLGAVRQVIIRAALQGITFPAAQPYSGYHRAIVYLNGRTDKGLSIGKVSSGDDRIAWRDQSAVIAETVPDPNSPGITNKDLHHGDNTLSLSATGDGMAGANDQIALNWVEITYARQLRAAGGYLRFRFDSTRGTTFEFDIRGFRTPNIEVWKLGMARLTNTEVREVYPENEPSSYAVRFLLTPTQAYEMIAFDDEYPKTPEAILPQYSTRDLRALAGAEYVMLVHESFLSDPSIEELRRRREVTFPGGVEVVTPTEIYEQFNYGIVNPEAIRNFLIYAYDHWTIRPTHFCIIGDGSFDMKDYGHTGGNLIPSLYPLTREYGRAASDALFGCVSGPPWDLIPDIAVGRISCRASDELETYVEKIAVYEDSSSYDTPWHSNYVFVADKTDAQFKFGLTFSEPVISVLPDYANVTRVYSDSIQPSQRVRELREAFNQGGVVVNYNGHGGGGLWSDVELMTVSSEAQLLNRKKYPFVTSFTCFSAVFDARHQSEVLGEAFLFQRNSNGELIGGIGVYASTGVGWAGTGERMQHQLFDFLPIPPGKTLGELVQLSKTRFWMTGQAVQLSMDETFSMQVMMNLLGDPGVRLAVPQALFEPVLDTTVVLPGDTVQVSGTVPFELSGASNIVQVWYIPYRDYRIWLPRDYPLSGYYEADIDKFPSYVPNFLVITTKDFKCDTLVVPAAFDTSASMGRYVVYLSNPGTLEDAVGYVSFYSYDRLDSTVFMNAEPWPDSVITTDTFYVQVKALNRKGVDTVYFRGVFTPPQGGVFGLDTMGMVKVAPDLWRTPVALGPYEALQATYNASFAAYDDSGGFARSATYLLPIESRPDISTSTSGDFGAPKVVGTTYPQLHVTLSKTTFAYSRPIDTLFVRVKGYSPWVGTRTDSFETNASITGVYQLSTAFTVDIPIHLKSGTWRLTTYADPDNLISELREDNNIVGVLLLPAANLPVSRTYGTYYANPLEFPVRDKYWQSGNRDTLELEVFPGSLIQDSSVLCYATPRWLTAAESLQIDTAWMRLLPATKSPHVYTVTLSDSSDRLGPNGVVEVSLYETTTNPLDSVNTFIFQRRLGSDFWRLLPTVSLEIVQDSTLDTTGHWNVYQRGLKFRARTNHLGTFTMFQPVDAHPPQIDIAVNGERFVPGAFVPADPQMFIYLSDPNGIDRRQGHFRIVLDEVAIPQADVSWTDTLDASGDQVALIRPHLVLGEHSIEVYASDNLANDTSYAASFSVAGTFDIDFALNYPNPFVDQTKIVYVLTGQTDEYVKVKIYTVAGRLIRTLQETEREVTNYRTLTWDGRDEAGEPVANGVYFGKIIAKQAGKRVEKILKMARVR